VNVVNQNDPPSADNVVEKLRRHRNKGKALVEPYTVLPSTTALVKQNRKSKKRRTSGNTPIPFEADLDDDVCFISVEEWNATKPAKYKRIKETPTKTKYNITIFGPDSQEIPLVEFQEDLSRAQYSRKRKVKLPDCMDKVYDLSPEATHTFPWGLCDNIIHRTFWFYLLAIGDHGSGWLTDKHLDAWIDLMWHFRPADANWAIARSYLCDYVMQVNVVNQNDPPSADNVVEKLRRHRNKGKALVEPYTVLPSTTALVKQNRKSKKRRTSGNTPIPFEADLDDDVCFISVEEWNATKPAKYKRIKETPTKTKYNITIFGPDSQEIPLVEFQEDLSRAQYSRKRKVKLPDCMDKVYDLSPEATHTFPWGLCDNIIHRTFWFYLLAIGDHGSGWLTDKHLDAWIDLMWHFRPADANWAIARSYLCDYVMRRDIPG
nr:phospholipase-like protein [Tanacetum cinerariifolium]